MCLALYTLTHSPINHLRIIRIHLIAALICVPFHVNIVLDNFIHFIIIFPSLSPHPQPFPSYQLIFPIRKQIRIRVFGIFDDASAEFQLKKLRYVIRCERVDADEFDSGQRFEEMFGKLSILTMRFKPCVLCHDAVFRAKWKYIHVDAIRCGELHS